MCWGKMLSWTWLSVLRGAAAAGSSEYRACKSSTLARANMRCWVQIPSQRMMKLNKSRKQNIFVMSFVQQNKYVPQYVPHGPHWLIFINKISNLKELNGGQTGIRTLGRLAPTTVFETAPFEHSGTCPY